MDHRGVEQALERLARATSDLHRAVQIGDGRAAAEALDRRGKDLEILQCAVGAGCLNAEQMAGLDRVLEQGTSAARLLVARRETCRVGIGETESQRRRLSSLAPCTPPPGFDVNA